MKTKLKFLSVVMGIVIICNIIISMTGNSSIDLLFEDVESEAACEKLSTNPSLLWKCEDLPITDCISPIDYSVIAPQCIYL